MVDAPPYIKGTDLRAEFVSYMASQNKQQRSSQELVDSVAKRELAVDARERAAAERERAVAERERIVTERELAVIGIGKGAKSGKTVKAKERTSTSGSAGRSTYAISSRLSGYAVETESKANSIERRAEDNKVNHDYHCKKQPNDDVDGKVSMKAEGHVKKNLPTKGLGRGGPGKKRAESAFNKFLKDNKGRFREDARRESSGGPVAPNAVSRLASVEWRRLKEQQGANKVADHTSIAE